MCRRDPTKRSGQFTHSIVVGVVEEVAADDDDLTLRWLEHRGPCFAMEGATEDGTSRGNNQVVREDTPQVCTGLDHERTRVEARDRDRSIRSAAPGDASGFKQSHGPRGSARAA